MLRSNREDCFKDLPRIFLELFVPQTHATIVFVEFKYNNINGVANAAKFRWMLDFL